MKGAAESPTVERDLSEDAHCNLVLVLASAHPSKESWSWGAASAPGRTGGDRGQNISP